MSADVATPVSVELEPEAGALFAISDPRLSEKTIELSFCAQFAQNFWHFPPFPFPMVWFGLTQAEERKHGYDAMTSLGGRAFVLQFKASAWVLSRGPYTGYRRFFCQHHQMVSLVTTFGASRLTCFYVFPNVGTNSELNSVHGDLLNNCLLVDVSGLPNPVPPPGRKNGYHHANTHFVHRTVVLSSEPFKPRYVYKAKDLFESQRFFEFQKTVDVVAMMKEYDKRNDEEADLFFKSAVMGIIPRL